jgi:hypothetical protein
VRVGRRSSRGRPGFAAGVAPGLAGAGEDGSVTATATLAVLSAGFASVPSSLTVKGTLNAPKAPKRTVSQSCACSGGESQSRLQSSSCPSARQPGPRVTWTAARLAPVGRVTRRWIPVADASVAEATGV